MEQTPKGFKKPTFGDPNDLYQFVGDNMDLLEVELNKKANISHTHEYPVDSVNGKVGVVNLTAMDIGAETPVDSQTKANTAETNAKNFANNLSGLKILDNRSVIPKPSDYATNRTANEFKSSTSVGLGGIAGTYVHVFSERAWSDPSGGYVHQLAYDGLTTRMWTRYGNQSTNVWSEWDELETKKGTQDSLLQYQSYHKGTSPPTNRNLLWIDTSV